LINFLQHKNEIISNFCNTFKKFAYKTIWGIDLNCNIKSKELVWLEQRLLRYQQLDDCCTQCASSYAPQNCILSLTAVKNSNPQFPFVALTPYCNTPGCNYSPVGDFNSDFNSDFFK